MELILIFMMKIIILLILIILIGHITLSLTIEREEDIKYINGYEC
jgi:hypothetical protein